MDPRLDTLFQQATKSGSLPGSFALVLNKEGDTLFKHASGTTNWQNDSASQMQFNTQTVIWSCSKVVTSICALQLLEQGKIKSINDLVEKYLPSASKLEVLHGWSEDGTPILKAPQTKPTILHLLTHTSGLVYDWNNPELFKWFKWMGMPPGAQLALGERRLFDVPLMFEPGTKYEYGFSTDWLGFVVEAVSGMKLPEYAKKYILEPLGLKHSVAYIDDENISEAGVLALHIRDLATGTLIAVPQMLPPKTSEAFGGGHWLISTPNDYSKILLTILNHGTHPISKVQILKPKTVEKYIFTDALSTFTELSNVSNKSDVGVWTTSIDPNCFTHDYTFMPSTRKGFSCGTLMVTKSDLVLTGSDGRKGRGRSKGSAAWFGMGNTYYWIDPEAGVLGIVGTNVLPCLHETMLELFNEVELATYEYLARA